MLWPADKEIHVAIRSRLATSDRPEYANIFGTVPAGQTKQFGPVRTQNFGDARSASETDRLNLRHLPVLRLTPGANPGDAIAGSPGVDAAVAVSYADLPFRQYATLK